MDNRLVKINATIFYTIDRNHPDINYMENKSTKTVRTFKDTYIFDKCRCAFETITEMKNYIRNDLKLIAGGGYDTKHIHNVRFEFEEV